MATLTRSLAGLSLLLVAAPAFSQPAPAAPAPASPPGAPPPAAAAPGAPPAALAPAPAAPRPAESLAAPAPAAPLLQAAPPAPPPAPPAAGPDKLSVGKSGGFFQPGLLLQGWGIVVNDAVNASTSTFRLRRAEFHAKGEIVPKLIGYRLMIDVAKLPAFTSTNVPVKGEVPAPTTAGTVAVPQPGADQSILQDFFITFMSDYADVSVGQFKTPVSLEGYAGSSKVILPERSAVARRFGDRRDIGVRIEKKLGDYFFYSAGLYNGSGLNRLDEDNEKDVALRLEVYPVKELTIGGVGYTTIGDRDGVVRDRVEADIKYESGGLLLQGEYIRGWDNAKPRQEGHGAYGLVGYTFAKVLQPVVRVGFLDPNVDKYGDLTGIYEGGLNYFIRGYEARLTAYVGVANPKVGPAVWTEILAAQVSY